MDGICFEITSRTSKILIMPGLLELGVPFWGPYMRDLPFWVHMRWPFFLETSILTLRVPHFKHAGLSRCRRTSSFNRQGPRASFWKINQLSRTRLQQERWWTAQTKPQSTAGLLGRSAGWVSLAAQGTWQLYFDQPVILRTALSEKPISGSQIQLRSGY